MPPPMSAAVIGCWGNRGRNGQGEPRNVIDSKRRRLKCLHPANDWGALQEGPSRELWNTI
jgi:hypothetical protein